MTKHFFKILILFSGMILLGLAGIFTVSYLDQASKDKESAIKAKATPCKEASQTAVKGKATGC